MEYIGEERRNKKVFQVKCISWMGRRTQTRRWEHENKSGFLIFFDFFSLSFFNSTLFLWALVGFSHIIYKHKQKRPKSVFVASIPFFHCFVVFSPSVQSESLSWCVKNAWENSSTQKRYILTPEPGEETRKKNQARNGKRCEKEKSHPKICDCVIYTFEQGAYRIRVIISHRERSHERCMRWRWIFTVIIVPVLWSHEMREMCVFGCLGNVMSELRVNRYYFSWDSHITRVKFIPIKIYFLTVSVVRPFDLSARSRAVTKRRRRKWKVHTAEKVHKEGQKFVQLDER